jgi:hypothetical protein
MVRARVVRPVRRAVAQAAVAAVAVVRARLVMSWVNAAPREASGPSASSAAVDPASGGAQRDGHGGGEVGEQVDQQQLTGVERGPSGQRGAEHGEGDLPEIAADEDAQGLAHRGPHAAALDQRGEDGFQPVIGDHQVGGGAGGRGGAAAQRDAHIGQADGGGIVGPIAGHGHGAA